MYEMRNYENTVPNIDWCIKQNLTNDSKTSHWFDNFMPIGKKAARFTTSSERSTIDNRENKKQCSTIHDMGEYSTHPLRSFWWRI